VSVEPIFVLFRPICVEPITVKKRLEKINERLISDCTPKSAGICCTVHNLVNAN
jgi:hypothetical protein